MVRMGVGRGRGGEEERRGGKGRGGEERRRGGEGREEE